MSDTITLEKARDIAYSWHGGMWSALYSFASSGEITESVLDEVESEVLAVKNSSLYEIGALTDLCLLKDFLAKSLEKTNHLGFEPVNLDCATDPKDLDELAEVLSTLAYYASVKADCMRRRGSGEIGRTTCWERMADEAYKRLPEWARW